MYFNEYFEIWLHSSAGVALSRVTVCWHPSTRILGSKIRKIWICLNSQAMVDSMVSWAAVMQQESLKIHFLSWTFQSLEQRNLSFALLKGNDYLPQYSDYMRWSNGGRWRHAAYSHSERVGDSASCGIAHMWQSCQSQQKDRNRWTAASACIPPGQCFCLGKEEMPSKTSPEVCISAGDEAQCSC